MVEIASHEHQTKLAEQRREYELTEAQMREYRAQCTGAAPMQQIFYVFSRQARDWNVPIPRDLEVYYEKYKTGTRRIAETQAHSPYESV